jgi:hypothetical protein
LLNKITKEMLNLPNDRNFLSCLALRAKAEAYSPEGGNFLIFDLPCQGVSVGCLPKDKKEQEEIPHMTLIDMRAIIEGPLIKSSGRSRNSFTKGGWHPQPKKETATNEKEKNECDIIFFVHHHLCFYYSWICRGE